MNLLEINIEKLCAILGGSLQNGLTGEQVKKLRREFGGNDLFKRQHNPGSLAKSFLGDVMVLLFLLLAAFTAIFRDDPSAYLCIAAVLILYLGFQILTYRYVERVNRKVDRFRKSHCRVIRDGKLQSVDASLLVPGDILLLKKGDMLPCDALIIDQKTLRVSEALITGGKTPVIKLSQEAVLKGNCPYYECILFAGTIIMSGEARAIVCNTGANLFDNSNRMIFKAFRGNMPTLYKKAQFLSKQVSLIWILLCFVIFLLGILNSEDVFSVFYLVTALSVAAAPDCMIALAELSLALGVDRLLKNNCVFKNLSAIDRLCDVNCVLVDNSKYFRYFRPRVHTVFVNNKRSKFKGLQERDNKRLFSYCASAVIHTDSDIVYNGKSVYQSFIAECAELGLTRETLEAELLPIQKLAYHPQTGMSKALLFDSGEYIVTAAGRPGSVLQACTGVIRDGERHVLSERDKRHLIDTYKVISNENEALLAVAYRRVAFDGDEAFLQKPVDLDFYGFIGLHTPIKADAAKAAAQCAKAGIDVLLMSDESYATAMGLSKSLSLLPEGARSISSTELYKADKGLFRADLKNYRVFLSLTGEQKQDVIRYRKNDGDIIAATCHSLDDTLTQLEADISFVSAEEKEEAVIQNADVVMAESGFENIPECIRFSRSVYHNVWHMLQYTMAVQFVLTFVSLGMIVLERRLIFSPPVMILFGMLVMIPCATAIAAKNASALPLKRPAGQENRNLSVQSLVVAPLFGGIITAIATVAAHRIALGLSQSAAQASAGALITLFVSGLALAFSFNADRGFSKNIFLNIKYLLLCVPVCCLGIVLILSPAAFGHLLGFSYPSLPLSLLSAAMGLIPALINDALKYIRRNLKNKGE